MDGIEIWDLFKGWLEEKKKKHSFWYPMNVHDDDGWIVIFAHMILN